MKPLSLSERLNQFATDQDDLSRRGEKNLAAEAAQAIDLLTAERDQLAAQAEELKAMHVDALGDGWYDGYLACKKDVSNEHFDIDTVNDSDVLEWSEHYESEHQYSKSIADIRAKAIESIDPVNFVSIALRHTTVCGDFDYQDVTDAFNYLAAEHRQAAKGGE
ncbi:hypothetical protein ACRN9T_03245 [Shewanella baltica]|uniref:hypothetical protein n=1 Tax=Shewanella baltica TaxID=62322 RepID=UPI003D7A65EF